MNDFFSWELLATFAGATAATALVTQFIKGVFAKVPTQAVSFVVALVVLSAVTAWQGGFTSWTSAVLVLLNAVAVSLASNGTYHAVQRMTGDALK